MIERRPAEIVAEADSISFMEAGKIIGSLVMPEAPKQDYAYLSEGGQLVMEPFATNFDHIAIPID